MTGELQSVGDYLAGLVVISSGVFAFCFFSFYSISVLVSPTPSPLTLVIAFFDPCMSLVLMATMVVLSYMLSSLASLSLPLL